MIQNSKKNIEVHNVRSAKVPWPKTGRPTHTFLSAINMDTIAISIVPSLVISNKKGIKVNVSNLRLTNDVIKHYCSQIDRLG